MKFKFLAALACAATIAFASPSFATSFVNTVDFSTIGFSDGASVDLLSGSGTDFHLTTSDSGGSSSLQVADHAKYHAASDYSGHPAVIAATDDGVLQLVIDSQPGQVFTKLVFGLGAQSNLTQDTDWFASDQTFATLFGVGTVSVDGTSGATLVFSGLNTTSFLLQFGQFQGAGLRYVTYTSATPIPGTLLLFGTSLAGLIALGRRRRML